VQVAGTSPRRDRAGRVVRSLLLLAGVVVAPLTGSLAAQASAQADGDARSIAGRITRPDAAADRPVAGAWVTLHRLSLIHI
jgi:hypothetical protein